MLKNTSIIGVVVILTGCTQTMKNNINIGNGIKEYRLTVIDDVDSKPIKGAIITFPPLSQQCVTDSNGVCAGKIEGLRNYIGSNIRYSIKKEGFDDESGHFFTFDVNYSNTGSASFETFKLHKTKIKKKLVFQMGTTVLNEDGLICESPEYLTNNTNLLSDYPTGRMLYNHKKDSVKIGTTQLVKSYIDTSELISSQMDTIVGNPFEKENQLTKINKNLELANKDTKITRSNDSSKQKENELDKESNFLKNCIVNEEETAVEIVDRKPISKIVKIRLKFNGSPAELWTYESHLTLK